MNIVELTKRVHQLNHKWWVDIETGKPLQRNLRELLALVISELSECLEGERKDLMDDKLPHRKMAEVEMADAVIRLMDIAGGFNMAEFVCEVKPVKGLEFPDNKGERIFGIMGAVICIDDDDGINMEYVNFTLTLIKMYCEKHGYDLYAALEEKLEFNKQRADHKHANRKKAGGKKF
jgi:hypothetical protein